MPARCKCSRHVKEVHGHLLKSVPNQHLPSKLTQVLLKCASFSPPLSPSYSFSLFNQLNLQFQSPNTFVWNTMIRIHTLSNSPSQALSLYSQMHQSRIPQDSHTLTFTLQACTHSRNLVFGQIIHTQVLKSPLQGQPHVHSSLIHMYAQFGLPALASKVFDEIPLRSPAAWSAVISAHAHVGDLGSCRRTFDDMPEKDIVAWNTMIDACNRCGQPQETLGAFGRMEALGFRPNIITLLAILSACKDVGDLEFGRWIHANYVSGSGFARGDDLCVKTALIDMYSKCGRVDLALDVFEGIEMKDQLAWTAIICGMAVNGRGETALALFNDMEKAKMRADEVTFIALLCACSHAGLVQEAQWYFESMVKDYGLTPRVEHYGCMVTIMARAGYLDEAWRIVESMPMKPNLVVWRSLLSACRTHGAAEMAEWVMKQLEVTDRERCDDSLVTLSNVYAEQGEWSEVERVRRLMKDNGTNKRWGCSFLHLQ